MPDLSAAWKTLERMVSGFIASLPRLVLAIVLLAVFFVLARVIRGVIIRASTKRREHSTLGVALGRVAQAAILLFGLLIAVTAAFPSFTPANLISTLGIGGVAIGFAFKDVFQNFLAGILILVTRPFRVGDQIRFKEYEGTVDEIQTRATFLKTYDGRRVIVPNGELYINTVTVNTAFEKRRWEYEVSIGFGEDLSRVREIILGALVDAKDVEPDPKADVVVVGMSKGVVNLRARWWTKSRMSDGLNAQDRVLSRIRNSLNEAGVQLT